MWRFLEDEGTIAAGVVVVLPGCWGKHGWTQKTIDISLRHSDTQEAKV